MYLALIEQAFWSDLDDAPALVSEYSAWAHGLGTPSICSMAEFSTGRVKAWVREPPDFDGAIRCYTRGCDWRRACGDLRAETANLLGLAFAHTRSTPMTPRRRVRSRSVRLREMRSTHGLFLLLDAVAGWFLRTGRSSRRRPLRVTSTVGRWPTVTATTGRRASEHEHSSSDPTGAH